MGAHGIRYKVWKLVEYFKVEVWVWVSNHRVYDCAEEKANELLYEYPNTDVVAVRVTDSKSIPHIIFEVLAKENHDRYMKAIQRMGESNI